MSDITKLLDNIAKEESAGRGELLLACEWRATVAAMRDAGVTTTEALYERQMVALRDEIGSLIDAENWDELVRVGGSSSDAEYEVWRRRRGIPGWVTREVLMP